MSTYSRYKTDAAAERDGVWIPAPGGERFKLARAGGANSRYGVVLAEKSKEAFALQSAGVTGDAVDEASRRAMAATLAEAVVMDWEGVTGDDGQPVPFSKEACRKLLQDLPELVKDIRATIESREAFLVANRKAAAGN